MAVVVLFARVIARHDRRRVTMRIDVWSVLLSAVGLVFVVLGMLQSKTWGWVTPLASPEINGVADRAARDLAHRVVHPGRGRAALGVLPPTAAPGRARAGRRWCTSSLFAIRQLRSGLSRARRPVRGHRRTVLHGAGLPADDARAGCARRPASGSSRCRSRSSCSRSSAPGCRGIWSPRRIVRVGQRDPGRQRHPAARRGLPRPAARACSRSACSSPVPRSACSRRSSATSTCRA